MDTDMLESIYAHASWANSKLFDTAAELTAALRWVGEDGLADQVGTLRVRQQCDCGDRFCQSFYTEPPPNRAYGPGHRNVALCPPGSGWLILDVVDDVIMYVEVLACSPSCRRPRQRSS